MTPIRAFIAFHLPTAVCDYLGQFTHALAAAAPPGAVRWVKPDALHVTLCFLGDSPAARLEALSAELDIVARRHPPCQLWLGPPGCFPNCRRPRVIWAGLQGDTPAAAQLAAHINRRAASLGWATDERPFQPHITLGRVNERFQRPDALNLPLDRPTPPLPAPVMAFSLMHSQLQPHGPLYTELRRFLLTGA